MTRRILRNAICTPDRTILRSYHNSDFKSHKDANGLTYFVDGGLEYARRSVNRDVPPHDLSIWEGDYNHASLRVMVEWGTRGEKGNLPLRYVTISVMSSDHLQACLDNVPRMAPQLRKIMVDELQYRLDDANRVK